MHHIYSAWTYTVVSCIIGIGKSRIMIYGTLIHHIIELSEITLISIYGYSMSLSTDIYIMALPIIYYNIDTVVLSQKHD